MTLTGNNQVSINELQQERKRKIETLKEKIQQNSVEKEAAFDKYQEAIANDKRLKSELYFIKRRFNNTQNELDGNKKAYRKPNKDEIRKVVQNINQRIQTRSEGAISLGIPYSTMCDHVKKNGIKPCNNKLNPPNIKILDFHLAELMNYIEEELDVTQSMMCEYLNNNCGINITQSSISRILKSVDITWKSSKPIPHRWNNVDVLKKRYEFVMEMFNYLPYEKIYIDECSFNLNLKRGKACGFKSELPGISCENKSNSMTLVDSVSSKRGQFYSIIDNEEGLINNPFTDIKFNNYLLQLSAEISRQDNVVLIFDKAEIHNNISDEVKKVFKDKGIEYIYLPPYSPFLSPIELYFNIIKGEVQKKAPSSFSSLANSISKIQSKYKNTDVCRGWIQHTAQYFPHCLDSVQFKGNILESNLKFEKS